jgi:alpha-L-rhamnosidase
MPLALQRPATALTAGICLLACVLGAVQAMGAAPFPPTNLRVNDAVDPVGTDATAYFGWFVNDPDKNEIQTKYQVLVASSETKLNANIGDVWDSGEVPSRQQNHVAYGGTTLTGDTQYFWKVRTWDKDANASPFSLTGKFVVGPLNNGDWSGALWIKRTSSAPDDYTYYRKKVGLPDRAVARATAYVSSVHQYALYVNGTLVGKGPAYHYPQYQYYNGYDITRLVTSNTTNLFAIFNHWFGGGQGRPTSARGVIMKAVIHYTDGTSTVVGTDGTWRQSQVTSWIAGQPHHNSGEGVGYVERIDARNLIPNWNTLSFDDSSWSTATEIGAPPIEPWINVLAPDLTRIAETELAPASVTDKGGGKYVIDLGKVYAGVPRITFSGGEPGTTVNMLGGYALGTNGMIDTARNQQTDMRYFAVLNGGTFTYEPVEYLGMRFFQIENSPMPVTTANFRFIERHSAMGLTNSSFSSSDATLTGVWDLMKHSLFTCAQESFLDTPTREKGGFLVDGAMQSIVAMPATGERLLTRRALHQFLQSMDQYWSSDADRGRINAVYPNVDGGRDIPDFTEAYPVWAWEYYMETGDKRFLANGYAKFKDIAGYLQRHTDATSGLVTKLTGGSGPYQYGIVDWPAAMRFGYDMTTARAVINDLAYADYDILSKIAAELGNTADRDAYRQRANALQSAINGHLISTNGVYVDGLNSAGAQSAHVSQHANMFPLALHLVPTANLGAVKDKVKELKMSVGMVTVMWLVRALGEADEGQHLIELYTNPNWNGWARCLARGATATWESWFSDTDGTSESHAWGAAGLYGYVRYVLGVTPLKPQYEQVQIKPLSFGAKLSSAKGTVPTDRGEIAVDWTRESDRYVLKVNIPVNLTANVHVPKGTATDSVLSVDGKPVTATAEGNYLVVADVGSGSHTFVRAFKPLPPKPVLTPQ